METGRWMNNIHIACEWTMRLAWVNLLWIGFTILGMVVFGFGPATAAMYSVMRRWVQKEQDVPIARTFWQAFRREFFAANRLVWFFLLIAILLYIDERFLGSVHGAMVPYLRIGTAFPIVVYVVTLLFLFPVLVHFDLSTSGHIKYAFLIGVSHPFETLWMLVASVVVYAAMLAFPALFLCFGGSCLSFASTWLAHRAFGKIAARTDTKVTEHADGGNWTIPEE